MRRLAALIALAAAAGLAACTGQQPFPARLPGTPADAALLALSDRAGIVVLPVAAPTSAQATAVGEALVTELQNQNVPAGTGPDAGNRGSARLAAGLTGGGNGAPPRLVWELTDASGRELGRGETVLASAGDEAAGLERLAAQAAPQIATALRPFDEEAPVADVRRIRLRTLAGAPGDGPRAVPRLMAHLLDRAGYEVVSDDGAADVVAVDGRFSTVPAANGSEHVSIVWRVTAADGRELGTVEQDNDIPGGALDGPWGDAAYYIAQGAVDGIVALLEEPGR